MTPNRKKILEYLHNKRGVWCDTTYKSACYVMNALYASGFPEAPPDKLFKELKTKYKPYTVKQMMIRAKTTERTALGSTVYGDWMTSNREAFRGAYTKREFIPSTASVAEFLDLAKSFAPGLYNGFLLMAYGGLRKAEVQSFRWSDFDKNTGEVFIYQGKGRKNRTVYIPMSVVAQMIPNESPFVVDQHKDMWRMAQRLSKNLGERITPHALRAFCLTNLSRRLSFPELMEFAGHSDIRTTMRYICVNKETLKRKIEEVYSEFTA